MTLHLTVPDGWEAWEVRDAFIERAREHDVYKRALIVECEKICTVRYWWRGGELCDTLPPLEV